MSTIPVIYRVSERPFPGRGEIPVAIGEAFAIMPTFADASEDEIWVWVYDGQHRENFYADYETLMAASREATPAEYAALMEALDFLDLQPCWHRTEEMRDAAYRKNLLSDLIMVCRRISEVDEPKLRHDLSRDWLEEAVGDAFDLISLAKRQVEHQAETRE